ncbi:hypothetical protein [Cohnella kolymensis]
MVKHLKGIGGSGAVGFGPNRVESIADAVAQALETHAGIISHEHAAAFETPIAATGYAEKTVTPYTSKDLCPSCGSASLLNVEGCKTCGNCGYSKCS